MSWFKKFAQALSTVTQIVIGFGPIFTRLTPTDKDDKALPAVIDSLQHLTGILAAIESIGLSLNLGGPDKLKAAIPLVAQLILQSDALAGSKIDNPAEFQAGVGDLISAWVRVVNSTKADVKTIDKT